MLLEFPNPKDPQDAEVAKMLLDDPERYALMANEWAVKYASAPRQDVDLSRWQKEGQGTKSDQGDDAKKYGQKTTAPPSPLGMHSSPLNTGPELLTMWQYFKQVHGIQPGARQPLCQHGL